MVSPSPQSHTLREIQHDPQPLRRFRMAPSKILLFAALLAACVLAADARRLLAPAGTVEVKKYKVYDDPDGGVAPLEERLAAAYKLWEPRQALLVVEAECRKNKDMECKKLKELKKEQKEQEEKEKADKEGDDKKDDKKKDEKKKAPCKTNVFLNYFLGTVCLPDKPFDVKPKKKEEDNY